MEKQTPRAIKATPKKSLENELGKKLLLIVVIPVILFCLLTILLLLRISGGQLTRIQENLTIQIENSIRQNLEIPFSSLEYLKAIYQHQNKGDTSVELFLNLMVDENDHFLDVFILSPEGKVLRTTNSKQSILGKDYSGFPFFRDLQKASGRWAETYISSATTDVSYTLALKDKDGNAYVCVYSLKDLQLLVEQLSQRSSVKIAVINEEQFFLAQTDYKVVTQRRQDLLIDFTREKQQIIREKNKLHVVKWSYLEGFGLYVVLYEELFMLYMPLIVTVVMFLLLLGGLMLTLAIFNRTLIHHLLLDMDQLIQMSSRLSHGDYDVKVEHFLFVELEILAESFNIMARTIEDSFMKLSESKNQLITLNRFLKDQYDQTKAKEEELKLVMESSYDGIIFLDSENRILRISSKGCRILELDTDRESLTGRDILPLLPEKIRSVQEKLIMESLLGMKAGICRIEMGKKILEDITIPVPGEDGTVKGLIISLRDITSKIRIEERLNRSERLEAVGRLAGGVAHDFNNILQIIFGYSSMIRETRRDDSDLVFLDKIDQTAEKAQELVNQLLSFCRMEKKEKKPLMLNDVVNAASEMLRRLAGSTIDLTIDLQCEDCRIFTHRSQIDQILMNLVVNARDAMNNRGSLSIRTFQEKRESRFFAVIEVEDSGPGIPEEIREKIFDPFFSTKETGKGNGLGLSTVFGIVQDNQGLLELETRMGRGSCFRILLPILTA